MYARQGAARGYKTATLGGSTQGIYTAAHTRASWVGELLLLLMVVVVLLLLWWWCVVAPTGRG